MPSRDFLVIMAAINGARRTKADHPQLPVTIDEIVAEAAAVHRAGAQALHLHVRDKAGKHCLDAGLYREATAAIRAAAGPNLIIQITTEAVGIYTPSQQMAVVRAVQPEAVSIAVSELVPDDLDTKNAAKFYAEIDAAGIAVQHILYSAADVVRFFALVRAGVCGAENTGDQHSVLFVLGRYATNQQSDPADLAPFLAEWAKCDPDRRSRFMVCAFGQSETAALVAGARAGGHCRIGFENNLLMTDGTVAADNAERIGELKQALTALPLRAASREETHAILGRR